MREYAAIEFSERWRQDQEQRQTGAIRHRRRSTVRKRARCAYAEYSRAIQERWRK